LKEEKLDLTVWRTHCGRSSGPIVRQVRVGGGGGGDDIAGVILQNLPSI